MSYGMEQKRADAGGYPAAVPEKSSDSDAVANRVRSLLRTWEQFGTGGEDTAIEELRKAVDGYSGQKRSDE